ncbi:MAG: tyrosine-type recombinase/integrase [Candidatus Ozemobacteraceae bacterium]
MTGKTRREVVRHAEDLRKKRMAGSGSEATVGEWLAYWVDTFVCNLRINTRAAYESVVKTHLIPNLGGIRLIDLRPAPVIEMFSKLLKTHSPGFVILARGVLSKSLNQAMTLEQISRSIMKSVPFPRRERKAHRIFTREEFQQFLEAARSSRYCLALLLFAGAGLRLGEALALRWEDVSIERSMITVTETVVRVPGGMVTNPAKTKLARRTIPIPDFLTQAMKETPEKRRTGLIVPGRWGGYLAPATFRSDLKKLLMNANLPRVTVHGLRHIHASMLISSGVDIFEVSRRLGHESISTTADVYGHLVPGKSGAAAEAIQKIGQVKGDRIL